MFLGNGAVSANELSKQDTPDVEALAPALDAPSTPAESVPAAQPVVEEPAQPAAPEVTTPALDKKQLENYISEVKSKLSAGTYANKTEESLALLNGELASAESTLSSATTQDELTKAYQKLVTFVSSGLKNKPKDAPKVDTTNGQPTVGKKAENTEPKSETNAIENSGSHDSRNGKEISKDNPFRTEATDTEGPVAEIPYSEGRNVYVYGGESEGFDIKIKDNSGVVANATILRGGNQPFTAVSGEKDMLDVEFGYKANVFSTETTASESNPAVIHYTGLPGGTLNQKQLEEARTKGLNLGWRYVKATDKAGNDLRAIDERDNKPGALYVVVKPQTYKYNIQQPENNANKIAVSDINNLTETDIQKIKDQIKIGYSKTSQDARFESKKGQDLDNQASVVKSIEVNGQTITVTYKDGSVDTTPVADVARTDLDPVVEFPFSDEPKREIYVYGAEENSFDIKIKDDADKIKSATLLQWGSNPFKPVEGEPDKVNTQYGYTANVISSETPATEAKPAVITYSGTPAPEGQFTQAKLEAATKGENPPGVALGWRYLKVVDSEGKEFVGSGKETANKMSLRVMLKPQTQKYDIQTPAEADKVAKEKQSKQKMLRRL